MYAISLAAWLCELALVGWGDTHKERSETGAAVIKISLSYPETEY